MYFADTDFYMPSKILSGKDVITRNSKALALGSKCFIVTGRSSAEKSGALADVIAALLENGIEYEIFNKIEENPQLLVCYEGGKRAYEFGADFVVGIGGGSPMDAAKAIAAFAANPGISPDDLFDAASLKPSLPMAVVPITAGTGSEANPYSIMTLADGTRKKTFNSIHSYPKLSYLDAKYLRSLGKRYTLSTALDAFCHCIESYLSPKADAVSSLFALNGAKMIWDVLSAHDFNNPGGETDEDASGLSYEERENLLFAAFYGGIAINRTGTGFPHPLGYSLTLHENDVPHGIACASFVGEFIGYNMKTEEGSALLGKFAAYLGTTVQEIAERLPAYASVKLKLDGATIEKYIDYVKDARNYKNSRYVIDRNEMTEIMTKLFG